MGITQPKLPRITNFHCLCNDFHGWIRTSKHIFYHLWIQSQWRASYVLRNLSLSPTILVFIFVPPYSLSQDFKSYLRIFHIFIYLQRSSPKCQHSPLTMRRPRLCSFILDETAPLTVFPNYWHSVFGIFYPILYTSCNFVFLLVIVPPAQVHKTTWVALNTITIHK